MARDDDLQRQSTYPLPPPPPPIPLHPVVETRMPTVAVPDPQAGQAAFGVPPSAGRRPPGEVFTGPGRAAQAAYPVVETRLPADPQAGAAFVPPSRGRRWPGVMTAEPPRPGPVRAVLGQQRPVQPEGSFAEPPAAAAAAVPPAAADDGMSYGDQMRNVGSFLAGGIATGVKHLVSYPGYGLHRLMDGATTPPAGVPAVAAATLPAPRGPGAAAAAPAIVPAAPPAVPAAPVQPAATAVPGAAGAFRFVDPSGRTVYTDRPGAAPAAAAPAVAPAATAAAVDAPMNTVQAGMLPTGLDQRLAQATAAAAARGEPLGPSAAAAGLPAGYGATIPGINAPASQAVTELDARNASVDRDQLAARLLRGRGGAAAAASLYTGADRNAAELTSAGMREAGATERARITDTGQTLRERETTAIRERNEGPLRAAQTAEAQTRVQTAHAVQAAQGAYQRAVASGDAKAIQKAEDALRAAQGKWEKTTPEVFGAVPVPGGVDPATGMPTGSGVVVYNKSTGEVARTMNAGEVKSGGARPGPAVGTVAQGYRFKGGDPSKPASWEKVK